MTTTKHTYWIYCNGAAVEISAIGRIELCDNGQSADAHQSVLLAHGMAGDIYFVLTSNGDDSCLGWLDECGDIEVAGDVEPSWLRGCGLQGDDVAAWLEDQMGDLIEHRIVDA